MFFNIKEAHLPLIAACQENFKTIFVHGDGNIYAKEEASDIHLRFADPDIESATYRVVIRKKSEVPTSVEELSQRLFAAKQETMIKEKNTVEKIEFDIVKVENKALPSKEK